MSPEAQWVFTTSTRSWGRVLAMCSHLQCPCVVPQGGRDGEWPQSLFFLAHHSVAGTPVSLCRAPSLCSQRCAFSLSLF